MKSFKLLDQQSRRVFTAIAVLVATIVPALSPVLVSAAQVTTRSITMSSTKPSDTSVSYKVAFTAVSAADAFLVDFCQESPLVGDTCTAPTGMVVTGAASTTSGVTAVSGTGHQILVTVPITAAGNVSVDITGITNPSSTGTFYARILTFATANVGHYTSTNPDNSGTNPHVDDGGVALSTNSSVSVNAAVLESLTFCVSGEVLAANCTGGGASAPATTAPALTLGETVGSTVALSTGAISTGSVYTQLSTNAVGGAVVNIKSTNACGGLMRVGAAVCDIQPANLTTLAAGTATIGVEPLSATGTTNSISGANGVLQPTGSYSTSGYALTYSGANTGVASTYGDPILTTNNTTANNMNNQLQFGASISNQTPAGKYSNSYSLIATGKF
jgi:hypothetical protein